MASDDELRETLRGMMKDWDSLTPEQRNDALKDARKRARGKERYDKEHKNWLLKHYGR